MTAPARLERDAREVTQRVVAAIDGHGLRVLVDDPAMPAARARSLIVGALARDLGADQSAFEWRRGK